MDLESQIRELRVEITNLKLKYKGKKHQDRDEKCELIYKGKAEAYEYCESKLIGIFKWLGIEY